MNQMTRIDRAALAKRSGWLKSPVNYASTMTKVAVERTLRFSREANRPLSESALFLSQLVDADCAREWLFIQTKWRNKIHGLS